MTLLEKKRIIIEKIEKSTSDDFILRIYYDVNQIENWDETEEGKELIMKLLTKSQEQVKKGEIILHEEHWELVKQKMESYKPFA